jgi:DNA repair exonuclease SbcCD ATPase subunit
MLNSLLSKGYEKLDDDTVGRKMRSFAADFVPNDKPLRELADKKERLAEEERIREQNAKEEEERKKAERAQKKSDDKKLADEKAKQREEQKALWESKKAAFKPTIDAINDKNKANEEALNGQSLYQRLQDPKFMPSFNLSAHYNEINAINEVGKVLKANGANVALQILMKNSEKVKLMHKFHKLDQQTTEAQGFIDKANEVYEGCQKIQAEQEKLAADPNYAKVDNVEELIAAADKKKQSVKAGNNEPQKESVQINPEQIDGVQPDEVSPVHEEPVVSKDPVVKNNP